MTSFRAAIFAALCSIFLASCGDTFRPIAIPQTGTLPPAQVSKTAQVITGTTVGTVTNFNMSGGTVTGQSNVGQGPVAAVLFGSRVYVANQTDNTLSVYLATTPQSPLPSTITLDPNSSPRALAAAPNGAAIYVAYGVPSGDLVANSIAIVGTATNTLSGRIPLNANGFTGDGPLAMITDNSGTKLFVANTGSNNISVIDLASNSVVAALGAGVCTTPMGFARTPDTPYIYVVCRDSNNVLILDRDLNVLTLTVPLPAGTLPTSAVYDATNKRLIVTDSGDASLSVLAEDLTRPVAEHHSITTVPLGATPVGAAVLPDGSRIYVANTNGTVTVVNSSTLTVKTVIPIGGPGVQVGPSSDSLRVAVTTSTPELKVVDTGTESVVTTFPLTGPPKALLIF